jgi:RNA polymerase sigma-70 factor (ECF subfamily)
MFAWLRSRPHLVLDDFHALLAARSPRWYSACLRITRDAALAEDAVQDALLKAWDKRTHFRGEAELDTWIHRIAVNAAIDLVRRLRPQLLADDDPLDAQLCARTPDSEHQALAFAAGLDDALKSLTELERCCFVLKHVEQWKLIEIAEELKISQDSVKQALFRALRKLRGALDVWRSEA